MVKSVNTSDGVPIAYDSAGAGDELVFLHGLGDERSIWRSVTQQLVDRYRCIRLDLRGHGQSGSARDYDGYGLARDAVAVLRAERCKAPVLVGHSLGGFVAANVAAQFPVRATIVVDQPLALTTMAKDVAPLLTRFEHEPASNILMSVLVQMGLGPLTAPQRHQLIESRSRLGRDVVPGIWRFLLEPPHLIEVRMNEILSATSCPFLSIACCPHPEGYTTWLRERVVRLHDESWSGAGHFPHLTEPLRLARTIEQFVHTL